VGAQCRGSSVLLAAMACSPWISQQRWRLHPSECETSSGSPCLRRLFKVNEKGSVPVLKDLKAGNWLASSDEIVDTLEERYPEPSLGKADSIPEA